MLKTVTAVDACDDGPVPAPDLSSNAMYFRYHLVEFVTEHLIDLSRCFDGDLQEALILAVIGQVHVQDRIKGAVDPASLTRSIAASRIADITRIPRQTVRRKLAALGRRGWIEQDEHKGWLISVRAGAAVAQGDLARLDARGIQRGIRLAAAYKERL